MNQIINGVINFFKAHRTAAIIIAVVAVALLIVVFGFFLSNR